MGYGFQIGPGYGACPYGTSRGVNCMFGILEIEFPAEDALRWPIGVHSFTWPSRALFLWS